MKVFYFAGLIFVTSILAARVDAAEIFVHGTAYSDAQCRYYTGSTAEFWIGVRGAHATGLKLHYAFSGTDRGRAVSWYRPSTKEMLPERGDAYTVQLKESVDSRGGYFLSHLQFYYEGNVNGVNHRSPSYSVAVPERECASSGLKELVVEETH